MKITYISASIIPSTKANTVNVMKMCNALSEVGHEVTLVGTKGQETDDVYSYYGVSNSFRLKLSRNNRLSSINRLVTGLMASKNSDLVYTRWIVAAMILITFFNKKVIFEYHAPYTKRLYRYFESRIIKSKKVVRHIFITKALKKYYLNKYPGIKHRDILVLPDAADLIRQKESQIQNKEYDCIYVGSFQKGKGVELVVELANRFPKLRFAIVGGSESEIEQLKSISTNNNIKWFGYLPHTEVYKVLSKATIALLPNQPKVLVGKSNQDIGKWTSPMKLFEYMANKKAIVASKLEVLEEILNEQNSILVSHDKINEWEDAIKRLLSDETLIESISRNAYNDLKSKYTWKSRAELALKNPH